MVTKTPINTVAYQRTIRLDVREITRRLNAALGGTLVSALPGSNDIKASHKRAKEGGPQPRPEAVKRVGHYRLGDGVALHSDGGGEISGADYTIGFVDIIEQGQLHRAHINLGY